jgi:hypothetical protein
VARGIDLRSTPVWGFAGEEWLIFPSKTRTRVPGLVAVEGFFVFHGGLEAQRAVETHGVVEGFDIVKDHAMLRAAARVAGIALPRHSALGVAQKDSIAALSSQLPFLLLNCSSYWRRRAGPGAGCCGSVGFMPVWDVTLLPVSSLSRKVHSKGSHPTPSNMGANERKNFAPR